ncbi:MAG TPA: hypothetical protein QF871_08890, partial [SAR324 cluster bacterium]|nr:hypothetical protein [SAR324 cluster bacterium]
MDTTLIKKTFFTTLLLLYVFIFCPVAWCQLTENSVQVMNPIPEILRTLIPEKQQIIMSGLAEFAEKYKKSPNSIKKYLLRKKRKKFLTEQLKDLVVSEWIGHIKTLRTTENGKAYLVLELPIFPSKNAENNHPVPEFRVTMGTWNNAY